MGPFLLVLLQVLPVIIDLLSKLLKRNGKLTAKDMDKLNNVLWHCHGLEDLAVKAGCVKGGVRP